MCVYFQHGLHMIDSFYDCPKCAYWLTEAVSQCSEKSCKKCISPLRHEWVWIKIQVVTIYWEWKKKTFIFVQGNQSHILRLLVSINQWIIAAVIIAWFVTISIYWNPLRMNQIHHWIDAYHGIKTRSLSIANFQFVAAISGPQIWHSWILIMRRICIDTWM